MTDPRSASVISERTLEEVRRCAGPLGVADRMLLGRFRPAPDAECEAAEFVVCVPAAIATPFDDNETGACSKCSAAVQFRPHAPKGPRRICVGCYVKAPTP